MATIRLKNAFDSRIYEFSLPPDIRPNKFKEFYDQMFFGPKRIQHGEEVDVEEAAKRWEVDKESAFKYLEFMKERRDLFRIKTRRDKAVWKIYIAGCSPEEESIYIRKGLVDWAGDWADNAVRNFFKRHPLFPGLLLRRLYMMTEYNEPFLPILARKNENQMAETLSCSST